MKTTIKRRAKSALAVVLTLCMVLSVFTIGIASAGAATVDSEGVGASDLGTVWFDNSKTNWSNVYCFVGKSGYVRAYEMDALSGNSTIFSKNIGGFTDRTALFFASAANSTMTNGTTSYNIDSTKTTLTSGNYTANITAGSDNGSLFYVTSSANNATLYRQTTKYVLASGEGNTSGSVGLGSSSWSNKADVMNYDGTNYFITYQNKSAAKYAVSVVKYEDWNTSYKYSARGTPTNCTFSNDGGNNNNLLITTTKTSDITITLTSENKIDVNAEIKKISTPTNVEINNVTASTVNASGNSTLTWTAVSGAASYEVYKGTTKVGSPTTNSYTIENTTANAGTYTVKAVPTDTGYETSDASSPVTLTVYESSYSLSGNDVANGAFLINGSAPAKTDPTGTNTWFNTYQPNYAINTPTATPGVYKFTFTVAEDYAGNPDISIAESGNTQRAFILNGSAYNTSTHGDITVTDAGISDSDNLYLYPISTPAGGSLYLKKGQTYTITIDQTKRYDSSSPYGKITIETGDIFAETAAKKQSFNATNGNWDAVSDAAATIGTASSEPVHSAKPSMTTVLTATVVNSDYNFVGWFTNAECTGTPAIAASACTQSGNTYTKSVTLTESTTYYALFKQNEAPQNNITLVQTSFGTLSITGGASGSGNSYTAYRGASVSINATTSDNSKTFSRWIITNASNDADITSSVCASPSQATTTFTMPAQNVKITAVYANKTPVNITVTSNNTSLGTATHTGGPYYVGDTIPIEATPVSGLNGGVFVRWVVTGGTVANANSASTTITQTGATVTARAVFENKTFQLYSDKDISGNTTNAKYTMIRLSDGRYVSTRTVNDTTGSFTIYDVKDQKYAVPDTADYEFNTGFTSRNNTSWSTSATTYKFKIKSGFSGDYYVIFDPNTGTYGNVSVTTTNPLGSIAQIYAKDGSIRYSDTNMTSGDLWEQDRGGTTANRGVTVVTQINGTSVPNPDTKRYPSTGLSDHLKVYSAAIGNTITIQTTVNSTYNTQGFYVGMFVINGWKVAATDVGNGKYTATYTLSDEYSVNNIDGAKSFEITPVYYNKNFEYVTFYVDAASVPDKWGETVSACADYNGADNAHFEGTYPGQPLGREGDLYEIKVSKYYYDYSSSTGKWSKHTNHQPSVTITAYNFDLVHHFYYVNATDEIYDAANNDNFQTYDYSDFNYLAKIPDIEAILFRCKYETSKNNWAIYADSDQDPPAANYNAKDPKWWAVDDHTSKLNSFQVLTDYYGNPIDALGNRIIKSGTTYYTADDVSTLLSQFSTDATSKIRIVSYGNRNTNDDSANSRTAARWSTGWAVFQGGADGTDRRIAYGNPADFICTTPGTASTANVHYLNSKDSSALIGKVTYITYDNEKTNQIANYGDTGERIDGQWYYSAMHAFDSNVKVAITTAPDTAVSSSDTTIEVDSNSANNTGYIGTTSNTKATLDGETTHTYNNVTTEAELKAVVGSGYTFVGWYIYDGSTYTKIHDNFADINTTMTMKKNYTIVAVVRKVGEGALAITHSRYTGSNPEAHDGTGKYYVSAVVGHSNNTTTEYPEALNSIVIPSLAATDKLTITIRTVCDGIDTFYGWYEEALGENYARTGNYYEICSETDDPLGETEVSYTFFEADCSTFFEGSTLKRKTIDLYSDIVHVSAYATLTYKYYDRFETSGKNQMVSYVVKNVPLNNDEIAAGFIPSDETIAKYAPKVVDTIYTDTKWTIMGTKVERAASNVTLMATQAPKNCYVLYLPNDVVANNLLQSTTEESAITDVPAWNSRTVPYNSWLIDENADMVNPQENDFYVSAPSTYTYTSGSDTVTWTFERFDVYSYDRTTGHTGNVIFSSNDKTFGYRIYSDCVIYPVYTTGNVSTTLTAKLEPAVLNREVYGDSASPTDRLYADLIISFINASNAVPGASIPEIIKNNVPAESGYTIETGVILDKSVNLTDADYNMLKHDAEEGDADTTDTVIANYTGFTAVSNVQTFVQGTETQSGNLTRYKNSDDAVRTMTNKNRLDKVFRYTNTAAAQKRIFAAYSYIVIRNSSNTVVAYAISDAQKFNFCYVGNKPLETVS